MKHKRVLGDTGGTRKKSNGEFFFTICNCQSNFILYLLLAPHLLHMVLAFPYIALPVEPYVLLTSSNLYSLTHVCMCLSVRIYLHSEYAFSVSPPHLRPLASCPSLLNRIISASLDSQRSNLYIDHGAHRRPTHQLSHSRPAVLYAQIISYDPFPPYLSYPFAFYLTWLDLTRTLQIRWFRTCEALFDTGFWRFCFPSVDIGYGSYMGYTIPLLPLCKVTATFISLGDLHLCFMKTNELNKDYNPD